MILHHYPDKNYREKLLRYLKIWLLVGFLLGLILLVYAMTGGTDKAEAKKRPSFNEIIEYTQDVGRCVKTLKGLRWDSNTEPDLAYYNVYRGELDNKNLIDWKFLGNTEHTQESIIYYKLGKDDRKNFFFYRVTAIDLSGLESKPSEVFSCLNQ